MQPLTLVQLLEIVRSLVQQPQTQQQWVVAELQDVQVRGGHCYMELLQKDDLGRQLARVRGCIWASTYQRIAPAFYRATGQQLATGLKVMIRVSASFHPQYGLSLVISEVNPEYTMGDLLRRRAEIIERLRREGVLEMNRQLTWPLVPQRIAVVSAPGAAGYGDFINQLYHSPNRLRFHTRLFPAVMQGVQAPASIIAALEQIAAEADRWDGVAIIRGGGATSDLQAFEDYALAATVAQFPLPIAIGIGHERDITVLDYIANARLKTPTAVAEWFISRGDAALSTLASLGSQILQTVTDRLTGYREQLAQCAGLLPVAATSAADRARSRLANAATQLQGVSGRLIAPQMERLTRCAALLQGVSGRLIHPQMERLTMLGQALATAANTATSRQRERLDSQSQLLDVLSPQATLRRGYSITRVGGHALKSADDIPAGTVIETTLATGTITSVTK